MTDRINLVNQIVNDAVVLNHVLVRFEMIKDLPKKERVKQYHGYSRIRLLDITATMIKEIVELNRSLREFSHDFPKRKCYDDNN